MATIWLTSDTHFSHKNIIGLGGRPFKNIQEMNTHMVGRWNEVVKPHDRVYHLGDVSMWAKENLEIVQSLNGTKILIPGNHDTFNCQTYLTYGFADVIGGKEFADGMGGQMICTHIPLHPSQLTRWSFNIHGHIHQDKVMTVQYLGEEIIENLEREGVYTDVYERVADPRYMCVSVEQTDYQPISLETIKANLKQRKGNNERGTTSQ